MDYDSALETLDKLSVQSEEALKEEIKKAKAEHVMQEKNLYKKMVQPNTM